MERVKHLRTGYALIWRRPTPGRAVATGYTLVELVAAIAIVGVLAAMALPRFAEMRRLANISALNAFRGTLVSAVNGFKAACLTSTTCNASSSFGGANYLLNDVGQKIAAGYGWPMAWDTTVWGGYNGVAGWLDYSGLTQVAYGVSGVDNAVFTLDSAPDPTNCYVKYRWAYANPYSVSVQTSGC